MAKLSVDDLDMQGKRVLMRADFNVPLDGDRITDTKRIDASLPTIEKILGAGGRLVLMSHLGRPKGERKPEFSLPPVAKALSERLGFDVPLVDDLLSDEAEAAVDALADHRGFRGGLARAGRGRRARVRAAAKRGNSAEGEGTQCDRESGHGILRVIS